MQRILVVEDDIMLNSGLCYNLELDGYKAVSVHDETTALEKIRSESSSASRSRAVRNTTGVSCTALIFFAQLKAIAIRQIHIQNDKNTHGGSVRLEHEKGDAIRK